VERSDLEVIEVDGLYLATLIKTRKSPQGSTFYTPNSSPFQVGVHVKQSGMHTKAHSYIRSQVIIEKPVQEIFFVASGKLVMNLYDKDNKHVIIRKELVAGDLMIISGSTAHGVDFLEDTRLIEIKQGPYEEEKKVVVEQ
jgi:mannose-6-phosphate isomerase-like protein (cupin superfamily)